MREKIITPASIYHTVLLFVDYRAVKSPIMKWQLYDKEDYSEIYFRVDSSPRSFLEWETVVRVNPKCVCWLSPNAFISHGYCDDWLSSMTEAKRSFPERCFIVKANSHRFLIWATTKMEAFRTLYEMTLYADFPSSFQGLVYLSEDDTTIKLPTMLLKSILEKPVNHVDFNWIKFVSEYAGRVLASTGCSKTISFSNCAFWPPAREAFVNGMLSKADKNSGCTGLHLYKTLFSSDEALVRLIEGHMLYDFSVFFDRSSHFSKRLQDSLRDSLKLQSLFLSPRNFLSFDDFSRFVSSLHSSSLRRLTIHRWDFRRTALPVQIFSKLLLTEFHMLDPCFDEAGWKSIQQALSKCKTLNRLEFSYIEWCSDDNKYKKGEFAIIFAQLLKDNPNILFTNTRRFFFSLDCFNFDARDDELYTIYFAPILEHNRLLKNLTIFKRKENYQVRGFLVAEAVGRLFAKKPSSCYTVLKANVDVLISYLTSDENAQQQVLREAVDASETVIYNPLSTTANKQEKRQTPFKRKR